MTKVMFLSDSGHLAHKRLILYLNKELSYVVSNY